VLTSLLFALATAGATTCAVPSEIQEGQAGLYCGLPRAVQQHARRRGMCGHFACEEPYDAARRPGLAAAIDEYCSGLDAATARLRRCYRDHPGVLRLLESYGGNVGM